jgi:hypothetical protein
MFKKALLFIALTATVANFSGCIFLAAGAAGAGTAKWLSDKVTSDCNAPVDKAAKATRFILTDMKADITKETTATDVTQILATDVNGKQIWVDIRPVGNNSTTISLRVGYMNGEADARKILDRIVNKANSWI